MVDYSDNKALNSAFQRGIEAHKAYNEGRFLEAQCPYKDKRTYYGSVTWSRAFITAWWRGWETIED